MIVPTPDDLRWSWQGVRVPSHSSGSAQVLPMTDEEKAGIAAREKRPFGFQVTPKKRKKKHK